MDRDTALKILHVLAEKSRADRAEMQRLVASAKPTLEDDVDLDEFSPSLRDALRGADRQIAMQAGQNARTLHALMSTLGPEMRQRQQEDPNWLYDAPYTFEEEVEKVEAAMKAKLRRGILAARTALEGSPW